MVGTDVTDINFPGEGTEPDIDMIRFVFIVLGKYQIIISDGILYIPYYLSGTF